MDVQYLLLLPIVCVLNSIDEKYDKNKEVAVPEL